LTGTVYFKCRRLHWFLIQLKQNPAWSLIS